MADKSSREIERELEQERAALRGTVDEFFNRMTLEGAWNRVGMYMRDNREEFGQTLGRVIKEKPIPVGLVAIGMAWIMFGPSSATRRPAQEERFRRADAQADAETRARLAAGDFDDTGAQGPTGSDARTDPWTAPMRTPAAATSAPRETGTGRLEGTPSPAKSAPVVPGDAAPSSAESLSGSRTTHATGSTSDRETKGAGAINTASGPVTTEAESSKKKT